MFSVEINPFNIDFCTSTSQGIANSRVLSLFLFINAVKPIHMKVSEVFLAYLINTINLHNI